MAFKVYVAGSSKEIERVRSVMAQLIEGGCEITHDWTRSVDEAIAAGFGNNSDADVPVRVRRECADKDIEAIRWSHAVLFLGSDEHNSRGAHVELGVGIGTQKILCAVGGDHTIFTDATGVYHTETDGQGIEYILWCAQNFVPVLEGPARPSLTELVARNLAWAHSKGWDDSLCAGLAHLSGDDDDERYVEPVKVDRNGVLAKLALIHTEISEAVEHVRDDNYTIHYKDGKPDGMVVELADAMIRIFHLCGELGLPLEAAVLEKMAYNESRPNKHGRKA